MYVWNGNLLRWEVDYKEWNCIIISNKSLEWDGKIASEHI